MSAVVELHLLRPWWLLALLPLSVLVWRMAKPAYISSNWHAVCDAHLLPHIVHQPIHAISRMMPWVVFFPAALLVVAMAGPVWHRLPQPVLYAQSALVILLDLSHSMDATDLPPSRLIRAKHKVMDVLRHHIEGQTALLVFARDPFVVTPLTHDTATISAQLASLDTSLMPLQGSRPDKAVQKAIELLRQGDIARGHLLLITDEWRGHESVVSRMAAEGHTLSILGVGTEQGAPIPLMDGGFLRDPQGAVAVATLDPAHLKKLAALGGGRYQPLRADNRDVEILLADRRHATLKRDSDHAEVMADIWREEGPWLVCFVLPLAALAMRKGILITFLLLLPGGVTEAQAMSWEDLWQRPDQRAMQRLIKGQSVPSANLFGDRAWQAVVHYRAGLYAQAVAAWEGEHGTLALYNRGTALAKWGRLEAAAQLFAKVLVQEPDHADARYNLEQIQRVVPVSGGDSILSRGGEGATQRSGAIEKAGRWVLQGGHATTVSSRTRAHTVGQRIPRGGEGGEKGSGGHAYKSNRKKGARTPSGPNSIMAPGDSGVLNGGEVEGPDSAHHTRDKESKLATEQWLRRVPDDPGGLLRRKFRYQYQRLRTTTITTGWDVQPW